MSFQKWIARRFAVGGTARLFAKQYNWLKQNKYKLDTPDKLIYNDIIMMRFKYPHTRDLMQMVIHKYLVRLFLYDIYKESDFDKNLLPSVPFGRDY